MRVRGEFLEMPGLRLTVEEARRILYNLARRVTRPREADSREFTASS